jgi:hypothetical protein
MSTATDVSGAPTLIINDEYNDVEREEVKAELQTKLIPISDSDAKEIEAARSTVRMSSVPNAANEHMFDEYGMPAGISDMGEIRSIADIFREFKMRPDDLLPCDDGPTPIYVLEEQGMIGADPTIQVLGAEAREKCTAQRVGSQADVESFLRFSSTRSPLGEKAREKPQSEIRASNDFYGTASAAFESHYIDEVIKAFNPPVKEKTDKYGRHFFLFDNDLTQSLVVVVFKVGGAQMVSINNVMIPLSEFLGLQSCEESFPTKEGTSKPSFGPTGSSLKIKAKNGELFEIKGVAVPTMTAVLAHLSAKYSPFA